MGSLFPSFWRWYQYRNRRSRSRRATSFRTSANTSVYIQHLPCSVTSMGEGRVNGGDKDYGARRQGKNRGHEIQDGV